MLQSMGSQSCIIGLEGSGISKTFSTCMSSALWKAGEKPVSSLVVLPDTKYSPINTGTDGVNRRRKNAQEGVGFGWAHRDIEVG